jgi:hypothetical protein
VAEATPSGGRAVSEAVEATISVLRPRAELSEQTLVRLEALMRQFARYVDRAHGAPMLQQVRSGVVEAYLAAPTHDGFEPGPSLRYFRRLAVRVLFRTCRQMGMEVGDPSLDVELPSRRPGAFRPLEDREIERGRAAAVAVAGRLRAAAAWSFCEATARTGELPWVRGADVDLSRARVWIRGTARTTGRWGHLTQWGTAQLSRYVAEVCLDPATPILSGGTPGSALAQSSAVGAIARTLRHAGLADAPGVRPSSVAAWAGRRIFEDTGRIDVTAQRLGMRSLDRTAHFIGWEWAGEGG